MDDRLRVLIMVEHYLPSASAGGPVQSIRNLVRCLGDKIHFDVVSGDGDAGSAGLSAGDTAARWDEGAARVRCLGRNERSLRGLRLLLQRGSWDLVYLNSLFAGNSTRVLLLRRFGRIPRIPLLLAPRGELQTGALSIHPRRKAAWLRLAMAAGLYREVAWHVATPRESEDVVRAFHERGHHVPPVHVARQVPLLTLAAAAAALGPDAADRPPKRPGRARVVFISRISPKKNLDYALRVFHDAIRSQPGDGGVEFDVYGPVTDERYWRRCQAEMAGDARVRYCGALEHDAVPRTFARYDLLLLPTRGESFGHVILEALAAGCPVLVSDRTPWRGLESRRAGWDVSLAEPGAFAACVRRIIGMDEQEHRGWVAGARAAARDWMHDASGIDAHLRMFEAVARRPAAGPEAGQADAGECTM